MAFFKLLLAVMGWALIPREREARGFLGTERGWELLSESASSYLISISMEWA